MTKRRFIALGVLLALIAVSRDGRGGDRLALFDEDALRFDRVEIYFTEPEGSYWNKRTVEVVRREGSYALKSQDASFISQMYAGLDLDESKPCRWSEDSIVYLVIDFVAADERETWIGDERRLFNAKTRACVDISQDKLATFNIAARLADRHFAKQRHKVQKR